MSRSSKDKLPLGQQWQVGKNAAALLRPQGARLSVILFCAVGLTTRLPLGAIVQGVILIVGCYGFVTVQNDLRDVHIDRHNKRHLPLADGRLQASQARVIRMTVAVIVVLALAVRPAAWPVLFVAVYGAVGWAYSDRPLQLSHRGLLGTCVLALCYAVLPFELAWRQVGAAHGRGSLAVVPLTFAAIAYVLYKDFKDEAGDRAHGKRTPLVMYGARAVRALSLACGLAAAAMVLMLAPTWWGGCVLCLGAACLARQCYRQQPSILLLHTFALSVLVAVLQAVR